MNKELTVPFDKNKQSMGLIVIPFVATISFLLFSKSFELRYILPFYMLIILQVVLMCTIALFSVIFIFLILQLISNEPFAILNHEGIWMKYYGFVPWDNIEEVNIYHLPFGSPSAETELVGIRFKDSELVSKKTPLSGKLGLFWARLFNYHYHANVGHIAYNEEIVRFAHQFIPSKAPTIINENKNYSHFLKKELGTWLCIYIPCLVGSFITRKFWKHELINIPFKNLTIIALIYIFVGAYIKYKRHTSRWSFFDN